KKKKKIPPRKKITGNDDSPDQNTARKSPTTSSRSPFRTCFSTSRITSSSSGNFKSAFSQPISHIEFTSGSLLQTSASSIFGSFLSTPLCFFCGNVEEAWRFTRGGLGNFCEAPLLLSASSSILRAVSTFCALVGGFFSSVAGRRAISLPCQILKREFYSLSS
ncbi:unnamed protein product, partial [Linum tenue]